MMRTHETKLCGLPAAFLLTRAFLYAVLQAWHGSAEPFETSSHTQHGQVGLKDCDGKWEKKV